MNTLGIGNTHVETFARESCVNCGITFFVPSGFQVEAQTRGRGFHCPNGHGMSYTETENTKLQKQVARLQERTSSLEEAKESWRRHSEMTERRLSAHRGLVTKLKKRVARGVCPCCSQTFKDVAAHMAEAHPGFGENDQQETT